MAEKPVIFSHNPDVCTVTVRCNIWTPQIPRGWCYGVHELHCPESSTQKTAIAMRQRQGPQVITRGVPKKPRLLVCPSPRAPRTTSATRAAIPDIAPAHRHVRGCGSGAWPGAWAGARPPPRRHSAAVIRRVGYSGVPRHGKWRFAGMVVLLKAVPNSSGHTPIHTPRCLQTHAPRCDEQPRSHPDLRSYPVRS